MNPNVDTAALAHAQKRLKEGASDAEVRIELLSRDLSAEQIAEVMFAATPRVSLNLPSLVIGLALCALAVGLFVTQLKESRSLGEFRSPKTIAVMAALGVAISIRGFVRRR